MCHIHITFFYLSGITWEMSPRRREKQVLTLCSTQIVRQLMEHSPPSSLSVSCCIKCDIMCDCCYIFLYLLYVFIIYWVISGSGNGGYISLWLWSQSYINSSICAFSTRTSFVDVTELPQPVFTQLEYGKVEAILTSAHTLSMGLSLVILKPSLIFVRSL